MLPAEGRSEIDESLISDAMASVKTFDEGMADMKISHVIKSVWGFISRANKYIDELDTIGKIVNLSNMSIDETNIILDNLYNKEISKLIKIDDYFLDNKIAYKVGDLK